MFPSTGKENNSGQAEEVQFSPRKSNTSIDKPLSNHRPAWTINLEYYFSEYCRSSSIHGIRYIGERGRYMLEKITWTLIITTVCYVCISLILKTYNKWVTSPVIVSFATTETPIWKIPFPAVTICPEVKSNPDIFNYTDVFIRKFYSEHVTADENRYFQSLSLICNGMDGESDFIKVFEDANLTVGEHVVHDLIKVAADIDPNNISIISWLGRELEGASLLSQSLSSEGLCYSFNMLHYEEILTTPALYLSGRSIKDTKSRKWTLENGYPAGDKLDSFPRRTFIAGINGGFMFNVYTNHSHLDYLCGKSLQGFKVTLHHPSELPNMDQHFRIPLDQAVLVAIKPRMITVSDDLKTYNPETRKCYFSTERRLKFFRSYTQQNCLDECLSNYTLKECGCVAFYMPKNITSSVCGPGNKECLDRSKVRYFLSQSDFETNNTVNNSYSKCDCLPSCTSLQYDVEISPTDWNWREGYEVFARLGNKWILGFDYETVHLSRLAVYYREMQFLTSERHELYGYVDFFSNTGGLLGLFIGFSVTSGIEMLYFLTFRLVCNIKMFGRHFWSGDKDLINAGKVSKSILLK